VKPLALLAALAFTAPAAAAPADRMLVTADEWHLVLSRQAVSPGRVQLQLHNAGEDGHDLAARRLDRRGHGSGRTLRIGEVAPGGLAEATWRLRRGRYRLWCTLRGHKRAGMRATLRVRR